MPEASVVIVLSQATSSLKTCFDSLRAQTRSDFEVLCVSTDSHGGNEAILDSYAAMDARFRVLRLPGRSVGAARNLGLREARGGYLLFLDGEDFCAPTLLASCLERAAASNADMTAFQHYRCSGEGAKPEAASELRDEAAIRGMTVFSYHDVPTAILDVVGTALWNKLFKTSFLRSSALCFQDLPVFEDTAFCVLALCQAGSITRVYEPLLYRRAGRERSTPTLQAFECLIAAIRNIIHESSALPYYRAIRYAIERYAVMRSTGYLYTEIRSSRSEITPYARVKSGYADICPLNLPEAALYFVRRPGGRLFMDAYTRLHRLFQEDFFRTIQPRHWSDKNLCALFLRVKMYDYHSLALSFLLRKARAMTNPLVRLANAILPWKYRSTLEEGLASCHAQIARCYHVIDFYSRDVRENAVLLIEANNCHGETLPGIADYLAKAGYAVDILITPAQHAADPLARYREPSLRVFVMDHEAMANVLASDKPARYEFLFFNSWQLYYRLGHTEWPDLRSYYPAVTAAKHGLLALEHHAHLADRQLSREGRVMTLADLSSGLPEKPFVVNAHFFGEIELSPKNADLTRFITVGAIEAERRNVPLLFEAAQSLIEKGLRGFRVTIIGRGGLGPIPKSLRSHVVYMGKVAYPLMYKAMEKADFFMPLLDPDNPEHDLYLHDSTSGSFQLIYGFRKPALIAGKFARQYGFHAANSLLYQSNHDLAHAMEQAMLMPASAYAAMQTRIALYADNLYDASLSNLISAMNKLKRQDN